MPKPIRASMKKIKVDAWKNDNSMWSIQEDCLRAALPLIKAIELNQSIQNQELKPLLTSAGSLLGSAIQRLSVHRLRRAEPFIKDSYLQDVKPSMTCLYGEEWAQKVDEDDKMNKVTQKVVTSTGKDSSSALKNKAKDKGSYSQSWSRKDKSQKYKSRYQPYQYRSNDRSFSGRSRYQSAQGTAKRSSFRHEQKTPQSFSKN